MDKQVSSIFPKFSPGLTSVTIKFILVSRVMHLTFSYKVATRHGVGTLLGSSRLVVGNPGAKEM